MISNALLFVICVLYFLFFLFLFLFICISNCSMLAEFEGQLLPQRNRSTRQLLISHGIHRVVDRFGWHAHIVGHHAHNRLFGCATFDTENWLFVDFSAANVIIDCILFVVFSLLLLLLFHYFHFVVRASCVIDFMQNCCACSQIITN